MPSFNSYLQTFFTPMINIGMTCTYLFYYLLHRAHAALINLRLPHDMAAICQRSISNSSRCLRTPVHARSRAVPHFHWRECRYHEVISRSVMARMGVLHHLYGGFHNCSFGHVNCNCPWTLGSRWGRWRNVVLRAVFPRTGTSARLRERPCARPVRVF